MVIEAKYYQKLAGQKVQCDLCPNECIIIDGRLGFCGVRKNQEGVLITLNYGLVSSIALDPIEKKPLYNFYPGSEILSLGTIGCNLKCKHCQNSEISQNFSGLPLKTMSVADLLKAVEDGQHKMVAFTYNEPFVWYEYILEASIKLQEAGIRTVLATNGYVNPEPLREILSYIDAFSFDIKWAKDTTAKALSGVKKAEPVFTAAKIIFDANKHLEIVTNIVAGFNDSDDELKKIAEFIAKQLSVKIPWHLTRAFPANKLADLTVTPLTTLEKARKIG